MQDGRRVDALFVLLSEIFARANDSNPSQRYKTEQYYDM